MEDALRQELLEETKQAQATGNTIVLLWGPWAEQGDAEAEYQLAYNCLRETPCDDGATCEEMRRLLRSAAAKDHPDAVWFLATLELDCHETNPEFERELLRAGKLGSIPAQRELGVVYATGAWSGPKDLAQAAFWYRLAAEKGHSESQYDLGFMLLRGEGGTKSTEEGLMWLERAGSQGEYLAFQLLADCYENGHCDVPVDVAKAQLWRSRLEEFERRNPPMRQYLMEGPKAQSTLECLWEIEGVSGFFSSGNNELSVAYDPAVITPAQLDGEIRAAGLTASPQE